MSKIKDLSHKLKKLSLEMFDVADDMANLYGKDFEHYHQLRGAARIAEDWAQNILREVYQNEKK